VLKNGYKKMGGGFGMRCEAKKKGTKGRQGKLQGKSEQASKITSYKRSEKGKLGAQIAKAITRKQGCENQE
jgi:hypothetical protein